MTTSPFGQPADAMNLRQAGLEAHESFRTLADHLPQIIWMADRSGWTYWHNRRWVEYSGMTPDASRGWGWLRRARPDQVDAQTATLRASFAAGEAWEHTLSLRGQDDVYRWFLVRAVPLEDDDGSVVRWYATNTDITSQIRVEDELREAARRKDALLAWLGHELRNPLTPILTAAHLLTMLGSSEPHLQDARDTIVRQTLQLSNLVDDMLDGGRISLGKLRLRRTRVALTPLVEQAIEACQGEIDRHRHRLDVSLAPQPLFIDADATRMVQLISNLLTNAAKYMRDGGAIAVVTEVEGDLAVVRVRDIGIGIAPDVVARVFDPYVQVGVGPLHAQGLGIGLALVKSIAEAHGGTVEARSEGLDRGSEFIVRIPTATPGT